VLDFYSYSSISYMRQRLTVSILGLSPHMQPDLERLSESLERVSGLRAFALNPQTEMAFLLVDESFDPLELENAFVAVGLRAEWPKQGMAFGQTPLERPLPNR